MKYFLKFALVCCFVSNTWTAPTNPDVEDPINPLLITSAAVVAGKLCGPSNALISLGIGRATAAGVKKYQETNDAFMAANVAAQHGIKGAADFIIACANVAIMGTSIANDIRESKDPKDVIIHRTQPTIDFLKNEILTKPKGQVANQLLTGANVAMTWTVGPIPAWIASTIARAALEGQQKFVDTGDLEESLKTAARTAYDSATELFQAVCTIVASSVDLAEDISYQRKDMKTAVIERCGQAFKSLLTKKRNTGDASNLISPSTSRASLKRILSRKDEPSTSRRKTK
ncbi:uncharacterized protein LOC116339805 [Contarinia nasturtii]|uniref:uncharacterized protein LOC116339805 n=1 Tax=Contarinia nasturtii TaxID=265458 RepID=UPI0012D40854|nr:uncharacterized protein LOC116339805 [Contarinia nasturtii]